MRALHAGCVRALHAEWTKLRTLASTWWLLAAVPVLTVVLGTAAAASASRTCPSRALCHADTVRLSLTGVWLSQALCLVLGVLAMGAEYGTGTIGVTLAAVPLRRRVLAAKAAVVALSTGVAAAAAVPLALAAARLVVPVPGPQARAAVGSVFCLVLVALLGLGLATLLRDTAAALTLGLGLLYAVPLLAELLPSVSWQHRLQRWAPMPAGLSVQWTRDLDRLVIGPWAGLGVLAAYAVGLLTAGGVAFRLRDA
ncbi:ABC transporter permease [Streptomyces mangrovisoli]|uniref:ABC transporter permease n=1 Tax=Streptomyces mangrovisoli TaxID=1428628 RepID=UPI000B2AB0E7|nr:ABC transporter permease [Streptomyces mangrovisoli]